MNGSSLLGQLIEALRCLPGVGPKSAQRMAFHILERDRAGGQRLAECLDSALEGIGRCRRCRTFTESAECRICTAADRDDRLLCAVETPSDILAIEQATDYRGRYFVLMGRLSPLDGIGPEELGLDQLADRLADGTVEELIVATNPTVEGEATAHYLSDMAGSYGIRASRIAHGVPIGGALEYVDSGTLAHAFNGRKTL
ncbi:MAG: recombination mediator RecR [Xanthomonadales bacterium]|nr:recombination mediator RecR [Xanthomonadales bacterium]